jgi:hypothetical protein
MFVSISPDFFPLLGVPVVAGRNFDPDDERAAGTAIVDEAFVRLVMHGRSPLGLHLTTDLGDAHARRAIVGVVRDLRLSRLSRPSVGTVYLSGFHPAWLTDYVFVKGVTPGELSRSIPGIYERIDPTIPAPQHYLTLESAAAADASQARFVASIFTLLGVLATGIALAGIYGVISFDVARRTREIGIRRALGAPSLAVFGSVLKRAAFLGGTGVAIGLVLAAQTTRAIGGLLFDIAPLDLPTFAAMTFAIAAVMELAAFLPARRAMRVEPMSALRFE